MYGCRCDDTGMGLALPAVGSVISTIGGLFGARPTGGAVYREDGARWSAAKQYWEKPPSTKASTQSPKPSGYGAYCSGAPTAAGGEAACLQRVSGGVVDPLVFIPKGCDFYRDGFSCTVRGPSIAQIQAQQSSPTPAPTPSAYPVQTAGVAGPVIAGMSAGPLILAGLAATALFALTRK